ncbi:MAG: ribosome biogenesis GTPase Der [Gammaproteobacteria bacterium]|nr:ribosome biogenesis GTPase Der [Gammaproteobacteria bacterium]
MSAAQEQPRAGARAPVLVLVGRPNTGKSTLFNRLTGTRDALVADLPGLTRDRQYGRGHYDDRSFIVVDTGGLMPAAGDPLAALAETQARLAIEDADVLLLLTDAREGLLPADRDIAVSLRRSGKPLRILVNKAEGLPKSQLTEFYELGCGEPWPISAEHGDGVSALLRELLADWPPEAVSADANDAIRVAVVGRPNVGKSTLVNRLLGETRVLTSELPGTTRDTIRVPFAYDRHRFLLMDTAGIRRRARTAQAIEKFSVVKALEAIDAAEVVIAMLDAQAAIGAHDAHLLGLVARYGRAMVIAINKWDGLSLSRRRELRQAIDYRLPFLDFVPLHFISALHGSGLRELMRDVVRARASALAELPTPQLNRVLQQALERHPPPAVVGRRIKLRYAHQAGRNPPVVMIHGNRTDRLPQTYRRYLVNVFREAFRLRGVPLRLELRSGDNPYVQRSGGQK